MTTKMMIRLVFLVLAVLSLLAVRAQAQEVTDPWSVDVPVANGAATGLIMWTADQAGDYVFSYLGDYRTNTLLSQAGLDYTEDENSDRFPTEWSLSGNGRFVAFSDLYDLDSTGRRAVYEPDVLLWDRVNETTVELPFNSSGCAERSPSISGSGRFVAYATNCVGGGDVKLFDRKTGKHIALPGLNDPSAWDGEPALGAGGRYIVFTSGRTGYGATRVYLYDRQVQALVKLPGMNFSKRPNFAPSISGDGNRIAFVSQKDARSSIVRLYDRTLGGFVGLRGIHDFYCLDPDLDPAVDCWKDYAPSLNAAGNLLVFVSNRNYSDGDRNDLLMFTYDVPAKLLTMLPMSYRFTKGPVEPAIR